MKTIKNNKWYCCVSFKSFHGYLKNNFLKVSILLVCISLLSACTQSLQSTDKEKAEDKHISFLYNFSTNSLDPHVDSS